MKKIDFTQNGGYRLKQNTFARMQDAYTEVLQALITALGLPNAGSFIISGCNITGADITPGLLYIDGDLCPFAGAPGTLATKLKKSTVTENLAFKNGANLPVFTTTTAVIDLTGIALNAMIRCAVVQDGSYQHTDNNFTTALLDKLNDIEAQAQKNVNADWTETNTASDAFIENKPDIYKILQQKSFLIGDFGDPPTTPYDQLITVPFPDIGTDEYQVLATLMSNGNWYYDNDVMFSIKAKTSNSFQISLCEPVTSVQNLILEYTLIEKRP